MDTSLWRDQKTLLWLDAIPQSVDRLNRWDIGTTSVATAAALSAADLSPDLVICLDDLEVVAKWCLEGHAAKPRIVAIRKDLVTHMGLESFAKLGLGNVVCLEELHEMYPAVGSSWDGSAEDAKILLASVLHFGVTFPATNPAGRQISGLRIEAATTVPQPLWFVTQYYKAQTSSRRTEIDACLQANLACPLIDRVVLLNELPVAPEHPKITEKVIGKRLTYADVIRWIYTSAPPGILIAFANADIFLDTPSWRTLWSCDIETVPKFLALLRWDVGSVQDTANAKIFGPRADSQDTWVISSSAVKAVTWDWEALDFPFGQGGCDNAITLELFKKKFLVANPALTLKTYHLHGSGVRNYDPRRVVEKPAFLYIQPTGLHDMKPLLNLPVGKKISFAPVERRIKGPLSAAQARTFCSMMDRSTEGKVKLDPAEANLWTPAPVNLSELSSVFYTRDGLAYTYDTLLVGRAKAATESWARSTVSYLSASIFVEDGVIAPLPDAVAKDPKRYVLEYLSKVLLMRSMFKKPWGEFWCSRDLAISETVRMFQWPSNEIPVISRDENQQTWCKSAVLWPYEDTQYVSKEEIGALRSVVGLGGWVTTVERKELVIVVDGVWITDEVAERMERELQGRLAVKMIWASRTSLDLSLRTLQGAWGVLLGKGALSAWIWLLPLGAFVYEVQSEMEPSIHILHTAAASELEHRLSIVPKGTPTERDLAGLTGKLLQAVMAELGEPDVAEAPTLLMPTGHKGFFAHAGDSFRQIAREWGRRGYVVCKDSPVHNIWLGGVGQTLLYDRPTHEWLIKSPKQESTWKQALFGNPRPTQGGVAWAFWPRQPLLLEELVQKGLPLKAWEVREKRLVFYGRSENSVQLGHRKRFDWSIVCDDFVHCEGAQPYPYTHAQYLERLANSRFGLCLAGYGFKCHREIECMAMGCVPIAGPDVDMTSYAEPPVEGLHYLRATTPAEVNDAIKMITPDRWMVMSVACKDWWKRNCSVDGLWRLTQELSS